MDRYRPRRRSLYRLQSRVQGANVLYEKSVGRTADAQERICRTRVQERRCEPNNSGKHLDQPIFPKTLEQPSEGCSHLSLSFQEFPFQEFLDG
jgi:hypothetical protein